MASDAILAVIDVPEGGPILAAWLALEGFLRVWLADRHSPTPTPVPAS